MTPVKKKSSFEQLNEVNVQDLAELKGKFTYLSWAHAATELLKKFPDSTWEVHEYEEWNEHGSSVQPYMKTGTGYFVKVTLTVDGVSRTQVHPVLDNRNQTIDKPNAFQINTSIQRCFAKAVALHGLGLYIFAGEDLPESDRPEKLTPQQWKMMKVLIKKMEDVSIPLNEIARVKNALRNDKFNSNNYATSVKTIENAIKKHKNLTGQTEKEVKAVSANQPTNNTTQKELENANTSSS